MIEVGSWYEIGSTVYLAVNRQGTVVKLFKTKWYKRFWLYILQAFGKKTHYQDVIDYFKQ